jgi:metal-dependent hydrolase (beta-lactamase superfamily II)
MSIRRGATSHTVLFDTGVSPDGMAANVEWLGLDVAAIEVVVLSHGHFDQAGGFPGLARLRGRSGMPLTVHPLVWTKRRFALPGQPTWELPTLNRSALEAEGLEVVERRQPSLLLDGSMLAFEPIIEPTVAAFKEMAPDLLVPAHFTGWKAQHRIAAALPSAFVPNAVGTSFTLGGCAA